MSVPHRFTQSCHFDVRRNLREKLDKDWIFCTELLAKISPYVEMTNFGEILCLELITSSKYQRTHLDVF